MEPALRQNRDRLRFRDRLKKRLQGQPTHESLRSRGLRLGRNVYFGWPTYFDYSFLWLISVGDDVTIANYCQILAHDASTKAQLGYTVLAPVEIGSRVYIGAGSIILPGVTIGDDAAVGAGSVVTSDIPSGVVAAGNPTRVLSSVADQVRRHKELMQSRPAYPAEDWTVEGGITDARKRQMSEELSSGPGYVE